MAQNKGKIEDEIFNDIKPTFQNWGIMGAFIYGGITIYTENIFKGVFIILIGSALVIVACTFLESIATITKLLRRIAEQNDEILKKLK